MKTFVEVSAKTVDEAIALGLAELNTTRDNVDVTVLEEGSKGLFGLFGSKQAKVALQLLNEELVDEIPTDENVQSECEHACCCKNESTEPCLEKDIVVEEVIENSMDKATQDEFIAKAIAFLKEVTTKMGCEVTIDCQFREDDTLFISMHGDELGILIGRHGDTLDALQYLTRLTINKDSEHFVRVVLDSEDYRAKREESLVRLANRMACKALKIGRSVSLEPMNAYERRIMHSALQAHVDIATHSEGEEPYRHLVITPRRR